MDPEEFENTLKRDCKSENFKSKGLENGKL